MANESSLWEYLKSKIDEANTGKEYILARLETGLTVRGIPDVIFLSRNAAVFIELKDITGSKIDLSPEQVNMIEEMVKLGYRVFVVARKRIKEGMTVLYVGYGYYVRNIARDGTDSTNLFEYRVGTKDIQEMLKKLQVVA